MFVGKIMPCLNKNWNDDSTRITSTLSVNTSASDEALAIVAIEKKMKIWLATQNDTDDDDLLSSQSLPTKKKNIGDKWTEDDIEKFYKKQVEISRKRKDCETGKEWDLGYRNYLASMLIHSKTSSKITMIYDTLHLWMMLKIVQMHQHMTTLLLQKEA